jgi:uncharacterized membrane protein YbaN (DUF454 family)
MDRMPDPQTGCARTAWVRSPRRLVLAAVGVVAVGVGAFGVFVPGLPTTIFLLIASYCFARSCPWLEQRLLRVPLFAPYMTFVDEGRPMSARARAVAMAAMWTSVLLSLTWLRATGRLSALLAGVIVGVAAIGTIVVLRFRRAPRGAAVAGESCSS